MATIESVDGFVKVSGRDCYQHRGTLARVGFAWRPTVQKWVARADHLTPLAWLRLRNVGLAGPEWDSESEPALARMRILGGDEAAIRQALGDGYKPRLEPHPHQRLATAAIATANCYLEHDMGTGKTKSVLDAVSLLGCRTTLVLCPKAVAPAWGHQSVVHGWEGREYEVLDLASPAWTTARKAKVLGEALARAAVRSAAWHLIVVVNYESYWRGILGKGMAAHEWDLICYDEAHRIKGHRSKQGKAVHGLTGRRVVAMSGTPMPNNPLDLFNQALAVDRALFGTNYWTYENQYTVKGGFEGRQVVAFKDMDGLRTAWKCVAHRVRKDEVLTLPPVTHEKVMVEIGKDARDLYDALCSDFEVQVEDGTITAQGALAEMLKLQQIAGGGVKDDDGNVHIVDDAKRLALADLLDALAADEPVVVFCKFRSDMDQVHMAAEALGRKSLELSGRRNELAEWQGGEAPVLAAQLQAGSVGVDMTRAGYCVYYSMGYSNSDYEQSLARTHRQGQTRNVTYYHLIARNTVDERVYRALASKQRVIDYIIDGIKNPENKS